MTIALSLGYHAVIPIALGSITVVFITHIIVTAVVVFVIKVSVTVSVNLAGFNKPSDVDKELLTTFGDSFGCCLPKKWRNAYDDQTEKNLNGRVNVSY